MTKRKCLECEETIQGRSDKKFCSDMCRNSYNNKINSDVTNFMRHVNNVLRKNRRILQELNPENTAKVHREMLTIKGFSFKYFTSTYTNRKNDTYFFCYEYGYLPIGEDFFFLVINKKAIED